MYSPILGFSYTSVYSCISGSFIPHLHPLSNVLDTRPLSSLFRSPPAPSTWLHLRSQFTPRLPSFRESPSPLVFLSVSYRTSLYPTSGLHSSSLTSYGVTLGVHCPSLVVVRGRRVCCLTGGGTNEVA